MRAFDFLHGFSFLFSAQRRILRVLLCFPVQQPQQGFRFVGSDQAAKIGVVQETVLIGAAKLGKLKKLTVPALGWKAVDIRCKI